MPRLPRMNLRLSGREQAVFYAMTFLTVIALVSTATFRQRTTETLTHVANSNRAWNHYLDLLANLEKSAGAVNAPANDVFASRDVQNERFRFHFLQAEFERSLGSLQQTIGTAMPHGDASEAQEALRAVERVEQYMASSAEAVFGQFETGHLADATKSGAEMDKHYADLRRKLAEMRVSWTGVESKYVEQQMSVINSLKNANAVIMAVNFLFILGLIISGSRMFQRLRESECELLKARNEAIRAGQVKARFVANISHEIRTPLNGIMGMARLLMDHELAPQPAYYIRTIRKCGTTMLALINDALLFSKMETDRVTLHCQPFDVQRAVEDVRELLAVTAGDKGLALSCRVDPGIPRYLIGDDTRFRQLLTNLIGNAIKFTDRGHVDVDVAVTPIRRNRYDVRLSVADTGIGIASETQRKLFQPFYQIKDERSADGMGGTGLGLAICKAICEAMHGTITVRSEIGRGATFIVQFRTEGIQDTSTIPSERPVCVRPDLGTRWPLRILLVEDNATNQLVMVQFLARLGYRADVVADGQEALEMIARRPYDVIFMDCRMPMMDGFEAARRIRETHADGRQPTIVALTASAFEDDRTKCLAAGMDDVLAKPLDLDVLQRVLQRWGRAEEMSGPTREVGKTDGTPVGPQGPVDVAALLEGFSGMERNLAAGIGTFLHDAPVIMSRIREALQARDCAKLLEAAHALGGTAAMFRAASAARLCADLQRQVREGNLDGAASLYRALETELDQVRGQMTLLKVHCQTVASENPVSL